MKKALMGVIALGLLVVASSAMAQGHDRQRHRHHHHHQQHNWVAPLIGGVIIGGAIANQYYRTPPYAPPVYVYPPEPVYVYPPVYGYGNTTVCRPVQAIDQYGYRYWTQECY